MFIRFTITWAIAHSADASAKALAYCRLRLLKYASTTIKIDVTEILFHEILMWWKYCAERMLIVKYSSLLDQIYH